MKLVDRWHEIEAELPQGWQAARLALTVPDDARCDRAAALLGPAGPGRFGKTIRFATARRGGGVGPDAIARLLRRLDREGIGGELQLVGSEESTAAPAVERRLLARAWNAALATLPVDWSDLYCQVSLTSTDHLEPAAVDLSPLNPRRFNDEPAFRFRCARRSGYGCSPEMVRRALERLDDRGIPGDVRILRALADTDLVYTQGPVWYEGGRVV